MPTFTSSYRGTLNGIGNTPQRVEITPVPTVGRIERVRAVVTAGTAINQVEVSVSTVAVPTTPLDTVFTTDTLIAQPLDQSPNYWYNTPAAGPGAIHGSLFVECRVDDATADHTIEVELIIENLVSTQT